MGADNNTANATEAAHAFIARWQGVTASELATAQPSSWTCASC
jgi:hypothetical protein